MLNKANTIATTEGHLTDGSVVSYRDADPSHIKQGRFHAILKGEPLKFHVTTDEGDTFGVDLVTGAFFAGAEVVTPTFVPTTPLRLIYYKRMSGSLIADEEGGYIHKMEYFVVGWQTTLLDGKNLKVGLKVFSHEKRYEITEDI